MMPRVSFHVRLPQLQGSTDVPLEIRNRDFTAVARLLTSEHVELDRGVYVALAHLPGGEQLLREFAIADNEQVVELAAEEEQQDLDVGNRSAPSVTPRPPKDAPRGDTRMYIRVFSGSPLDQLRPQAPGDALVAVPGAAGQDLQFRLRNMFEGVSFVQVLQPGHPVMNIAVPAAPREGARLVLRPCPGGGPAVELHLDNSVGDALLACIRGAEWNEVETLTKSDAFDAEALLQGKGQDPVAATVGAYALLRLGELERLRDWTTNLCNRFAWLPDGAAILGEHMARLGRHREAIKAFMQVPERGLPIFYDGLAWTQSRLRVYAQAKDTPPVDIEEVNAAIARLQPFLLFADLRSPLLCYSGRDPSKPEREVAEPPENTPTDWFVTS